MKKNFGNNKVMTNTIHVINLSTDQPTDPYRPDLTQKILRLREERALSIVRQSKEQGFAVQFWPGVIVEKQTRHKNIAEAFKQIVRYALENDLREITIAEDDALFTAPNAWRHYREMAPMSFDLYHGGIYAGNIKVVDWKHNKLYKIENGYSGHTLVTVHKNFYEEFLSINCDTLHLDRALGMIAHKKNFYVCRPFVVKQITPTYSENHRKEISNYSAYEENWEYLQ